MWRRTFVGAGAAAVCGLGAATDFTEGLPDFSQCGYAGGGVPIPVAPVRVEVKPAAGDATARIQAAIDQVSALPLDRRGAVLLKKGPYSVGGTLRIGASGVVLRGEGRGEDGTVLTAAGTEPRALIEFLGAGPGTLARESAAIVDEVVPVGARRFQVRPAGGFRVGQLVVVRRKSNAEWIHEIGMDRIQVRAGDESTTRQWTPFDLDFERVITAMDGDRITVDAPVMCAIERRWGGGQVMGFDDRGRIRGSGVEHLRGVSAFDRGVEAEYGRVKERYFSDEAHASDLVSVDNANDCWVRDVAALHFTFSCVNVKRTRQVTVENCECREMVSQITGSRRYCYSVSGQLTLVRQCAGDTGRHDFAVGARVAGPNVFLECAAGRSFATSEPHHRWSVGGLYDNVKADIAFQDRQYYGTGHGWSGANYVAWNCEGTLVCQQPPTAQNWAIGHVGKKVPGAFAPRPDGDWRSMGRHVAPRSLYLAQMAARLKRTAAAG
ncbi:MAG: hypothetical protein SGI92_30565 [Bryobacteraceae bacterium]|nr:hypothetical protein [Bryobacteraceae bacterium]